MIHFFFFLLPLLSNFVAKKSFSKKRQKYNGEADLIYQQLQQKMEKRIIKKIKEYIKELLTPTVIFCLLFFSVTQCLTLYVNIFFYKIRLRSSGIMTILSRVFKSFKLLPILFTEQVTETYFMLPSYDQLYQPFCKGRSPR